MLLDVDARTEALDALLLMPAPDIGALSKKLEIFFREDCCHLMAVHSEPLIAAVLADARRLAGEAHHG